MKKLLQLVLMAILIAANGFAQGSLWQKTTLERIGDLPLMDRASMPLKYQLYALDLSALKNQLQSAPLDSSGQNSNVILSFPNPDGGFDRYAFFESPIMEQGLADQFPDIKTYLAKGVTDPTASLRLSFTQFGLHVMRLSGLDTTMYIDTYTSDLNNFIVYRKSDVTRTSSFACEFDQYNTEPFRPIETNAVFTSDGNLRTYRLAMACTGEYAAFHGGTVAGAQAAIVVTVNRLNLVYERDFSARLVLVANNNLLIYTNAATDPYTNNNGATMLTENQNNVTAVIGAANYDVGHVVSTGGGGIAGLGVFCNNSQKARGVTGSPAPVGDPFDIDYVAHEIGHQFGCNHTQNNSCQRNGATAVEPGSASTIMGYAGICAPNVQSNSDDHFSFISIQEAIARTFVGTSCAALTPNNNFAPVVSAGLDFTIPKSTAFILTGVATDANNDSLTYCWEQTNNEVSTQSPLTTSTAGPNFRSNIPIASPQRFMPRIQDVINNNLAPTWEVVPSVARTMNFALTVRDNRTPNGGQTNRDDMVVTTADVGPFLVDSPNTAVSWVAGSNQTVTWTVAGTTANNINAEFVDILISNDGGFTYPIILASKVPNDGSETITVPNTVGFNNRIMVRGYKHIFYDISNTNFTITTAPATFSVAFSGVEEQQNKSACQGTNVTYNISYLALSGFSAATTFSASGLPTGATATFAPASVSANGTVVMTIGNTTSSPAGTYNIIVSATSGTTTKIVPFYFSLFSATFAPMNLTSPANNAIGQPPSLTLSWAANPNASSYDVQVATSNTFANIVSSGNTTATSYAVSGLAPTTDYFWRVLPRNTICGVGTYSSPFKFTTAGTSCNVFSYTGVPVVIPPTGPQTITSTITVPSGVIITDVNVTTDITHTWINDLTLRITSPAGTAVNLVVRPCSPSSSVNNIVATFDDSGIPIVCGNFPGIGGTVVPAQPLSALNGENSTGTWTFTVVDAFDQDGGVINSWSLNICGSPPLTVRENMLQDFVVYPNPNKGNFTVQFTNNENQEVQVEVFDIRGRKILENKYSSQTNFSEDIQLNNAGKGVYLVKVSNGTWSEVKKIVVE